MAVPGTSIRSNFCLFSDGDRLLRDRLVCSGSHLSVAPRTDRPSDASPRRPSLPAQHRVRSTAVRLSTRSTASLRCSRVRRAISRTSARFRRRRPGSFIVASTTWRGQIKPGTTLSYGEVAARVGEPDAARAVGQALGSNPIPIIVPCHRVLAARRRNGRLLRAGRHGDEAAPAGHRRRAIVVVSGFSRTSASA